MTEVEALNKITGYCSAGEHCRSEVVEKMQRWGLPYETVNRIVEHLVEEKVIDEVR